MDKFEIFLILLCVPWVNSMIEAVYLTRTTVTLFRCVRERVIIQALEVKTPQKDKAHARRAGIYTLNVAFTPLVGGDHGPPLSLTNHKNLPSLDLLIHNLT